jgi:hypothetical protein
MTRLLPNQRREVRRHREQLAWIKFDDEPTSHECHVTDVSKHGAKILANLKPAIGTRFGLALIPDHPERQRCEIVWQRGKMIGIKFVDSPLARHRAGGPATLREIIAAIASTPREQRRHSNPTISKAQFVA